MSRRRTSNLTKAVGVSEAMAKEENNPLTESLLVSTDVEEERTDVVTPVANVENGV